MYSLSFPIKSDCDIHLCDLHIETSVGIVVVVVFIRIIVLFNWIFDRFNRGTASSGFALEGGEAREIGGSGSRVESEGSTAGGTEIDSVVFENCTNLFED